MTIAEKMLELLDEGWGTKVLRRYGADGKMKFRCAVGIRLDASGMADILDEVTAADALRSDLVMVALARIIREQYPEFPQDLAANMSDETARLVLASNVNVVMLFNDRYARLPDIRAIIEKAIAEGF